MTLPPGLTQKDFSDDEEHAYALVEPGVSMFDLYRYIQEKGAETLGGRAEPGLEQRAWLHP